MYKSQWQRSDNLILMDSQRWCERITCSLFVFQLLIFIRSYHNTGLNMKCASVMITHILFHYFKVITQEGVYDFVQRDSE